MIFTNAYSRTVDSKSRLQIPSQVRELMQADRRSGVLYLVPGGRAQTLELHLEAEFEKLSGTMERDLIPDDDTSTFNDMFYSMAVRLEMDKQGRVVLPESSIQRAELGAEVVLTGAGNHLVLWDKQAYTAFVDDNWSRWQQVRELARAASRKTSRADIDQ